MDFGVSICEGETGGSVVEVRREVNNVGRAWRVSRRISGHGYGEGCIVVAIPLIVIAQSRIKSYK